MADAPAETQPTAAAPATESSTSTSTAPAPANKDDAGKPLMAVKVFAPFKVYFEGAAYSLTALNETGPFDILPRHHNFLCMLLPCELVIITPGDTKIIKISRALMHVKAEKVTVYLDV